MHLNRIHWLSALEVDGLAGIHMCDILIGNNDVICW